jgi:hypothetical protein
MRHESRHAKLTPFAAPPIIFTTPGTKPDACLYVFSKEFHVSSASLKLNSTYFRKWLEPSEGIIPTSIRSGFASEWFTQVNGDGTWALTSDAKVSTQRCRRISGFSC